MKLRISTVLLLALLASCGREGLKEDITLPELPPQEKVVEVVYPKKGTTFKSGDVNELENRLYIQWLGLPIEDTIKIQMDLYKNDDFILILQTRPGVDSTICRIPDSLVTSSHYRVKVYKKDVPDVYGFSDEFTIKGLPAGDSVSIPQSK